MLAARTAVAACAAVAGITILRDGDHRRRGSPVGDGGFKDDHRACNTTDGTDAMSKLSNLLCNLKNGKKVVH